MTKRKRKGKRKKERKKRQPRPNTRLPESLPIRHDDMKTRKQKRDKYPENNPDKKFKPQSKQDWKWKREMTNTKPRTKRKKKNQMRKMCNSQTPAPVPYPTELAPNLCYPSCHIPTLFPYSTAPHARLGSFERWPSLSAPPVRGVVTIV